MLCPDRILLNFDCTTLSNCIHQNKFYQKKDSAHLVAKIQNMNIKLLIYSVQCALHVYHAVHHYKGPSRGGQCKNVNFSYCQCQMSIWSIGAQLNMLRFEWSSIYSFFALVAQMISKAVNCIACVATRSTCNLNIFHRHTTQIEYTFICILILYEKKQIIYESAHEYGWDLWPFLCHTSHLCLYSHI